MLQRLITRDPEPLHGIGKGVVYATTGSREVVIQPQHRLYRQWVYRSSWPRQPGWAPAGPVRPPASERHIRVAPTGLNGSRAEVSVAQSD